jgi:rhamnose utilization protein RhaD (predicted bifunctional aldolase and dehydrogenase)
VTFAVRPSEVPAELVALTRRIGDPAADLVVLAEGNTSMRLGDDRFVVKASGSRMDVAEPGDFVLGDLPELVDVLERGGTDQETLSRLLSAEEPASAGGSADPSSPPERSGGNQAQRDRAPGEQNAA